MGEAQFPGQTIDGTDDQTDYFSFSLTEPKRVSVGLRQLDFNVDLSLEDSQGETIKQSAKSGTSNEAITQTLLEGTYFIRMDAMETGENRYKLRYGGRSSRLEEGRRPPLQGIVHSPQAGTATGGGDRQL